jgi:hypothetical protein
LGLEGFVVVVYIPMMGDISAILHAHL